MDRQEKEQNKRGFVEDSDYNLLMTSMRVSVSKHLLDKHFTVVWANDYYYDLIGYSKEEYEAVFHNQCDRYFQSNIDDWDNLVDNVTKAIATGQTRYEHITRMRNKSGHTMWIKIVGTFTREMADGTPIAYTVMTDISDLIQMQVEQTVTYNSIPGFVAKFRIRETSFQFVDANERFSNFFGCQHQYSLVNLKDQENEATCRKNHGVMRKGKPVQFTLKALDSAGNPVWLQLNGDCIDWVEGDPVYLIVYIDITDITRQRELQKETNAQLERLAFIDPVTEGYNRTCFELQAGKAVKASPPGTYECVCLDVQKFKLINDLYGIEGGNLTLKYVHDIICKHLEQGEYVARTSADNFSLLLKACPQEELETRLNTMAREINSFNLNAEHKYILSLTAGVYTIDDPELPIMQIQDRANVARKNLKNTAGAKLCVCMFYSELDRLKMMREKEMENRMQDALRNEEFIVYLQPKQSLQDQSIAGAEALVRWLDPEKGLIPPNDFIPFFEKNNFIVKLDLYVFEKVCALLRKWMDRGVRLLPISVNISRAHFIDPDFLQQYEEIRKKYGVPPALLEMELTETLVFENPEALIKVIDEFHQCGYRCSMDDFGSGYSSLNILKDISVDTVKLDRAFFSSQQMDNPRERVVIMSIINMTDKLDMTTVAEGVETPAQAQFLREASCDLLQGYVFSRPVPVKDFEQMAFGQHIP